MFFCKFRCAEIDIQTIDICIFLFRYDGDFTFT